jgi:hypothetical protein
MTTTIRTSSGNDVVLIRDREYRPCSAIREKCIRLNVRWRYLGISKHGYRYYEFSIAGLAGEEDRVVKPHIEHGRMATWLDGWQAAVRASAPL